MYSVSMKIICKPHLQYQGAIFAFISPKHINFAWLSRKAKLNILRYISVSNYTTIARNEHNFN